MEAVATSVAERKQISFLRLLAINAFKFGGDGVHWTPLNTIILQVLAVAVAGGTTRGTLVVAQASSAGAVFAVVVPILVGYLSDRTSTRFGRRRPWITIGTLFNLFGLGLLAGAGAVAGLWVVGIFTAGTVMISLAAIPEAPLQRLRSAVRIRIPMRVGVAAIGFIVVLAALEFVLLTPVSTWWFV